MNERKRRGFRKPRDKEAEARAKERAINQETAAFTAALESNSVDQLNNFIRSYPNSEYLEQVREKIAEVRKNVRKTTPPPIPEKEQSVEQPAYKLPSTGGKTSTKISSPTAQEMEERITRLEEIDSNLVFMFGNPGSSKTTVLAALNATLTTDYIAYPNTEMDAQIKQDVNKMTRALKQGHFPPVTSVERIFEYDVAVRKPEMKDFCYLSILEMSGERHKTILGTPTRDIQTYLSADLDRVFILVVAMDEIRAKDDRDPSTLMRDFISYIKANDIDTSRVALVISKYDRDGNNPPLETLLETELKGLKNIFEYDLDGDAKIFPFSVGEVSESKQSIKKLDLRDCIPIIDWILSVSSEHYKPERSGKIGFWQRIAQLFGF